MSEISKQDIENTLSRCHVPFLDADVISIKAVKSIEITRQSVSVRVSLGFPCDSKLVEIQQLLSAAIKQLLETEKQDLSVDVAVDWRVLPHVTQGTIPAMAQIKNIIAVASGKGGVGKSTTAVNLALALAAEGGRVGLLDADIYGPSIPMMLGVQDGTRPGQVENKYFSPVEAHGLQTMSIGYLVTEKTPMVWRGPMATGALKQLLEQTLWDDLDYLLIDMPPGTGDIQLTLAQSVPLTGSVIVTTPQDIALLDARKGIEMFSKVNVPILGIVENMSLHTCSQCGHSEPIFGEGGGVRIAEEYAVPLLGSLPLDIRIREQVGNGMPCVVSEPDGDLAVRYGSVALNISSGLAMMETDVKIPNISMVED